MKVIPTRYVSFPYAIPPMRGMYGDLVPAEDSVSLWLRAWPGLLGWQQSINWLWPRVVDSPKKARPGLWGVDSIGSLVIIDIVSGDAPDPFAGFVRDLKSASVNDEWRKDALRAKWLWGSQNFFAHDARKQLEAAYSLNFVPLICDDSYESSIERSLYLSNAVRNPPPVLISVVASTRADFRLSEKGRKSFALVQKYMGHEQVLLHSISAKLNAKELRIECRTPESNDAGRSVTTTIY
jgi:hypothetical protein